MTRVALALVLSAAVAACNRQPTPEAAGPLTGALLPAATPRPDFTLEALDGAPFPFRERTAGRLTLLFFGYTNCPDVCPATMANLGAVFNRLGSAERDRIDVVFVTTDPERDTEDRIRTWLGGFDRRFIGLRGSTEALEAAQRAAGVGVAIRDTAGGNYTVSHAAQVLVYSPDDSSHIAYPFGTRQSEWAADLPKLLERWPAR